MAEKRLMRSTSDRMIAGVCAGLADYLGIDPTIMRVLFVVLALAGGPGILAYLILWIVMPEGETVGSGEPPAAPPAE